MPKSHTCAIILASLVWSHSAFADIETDCLLMDGEKGIAACTAAIATKPSVKKNFVYRSAKYSDARRFDLALADAGKALGLDPKSAGGHAVLAKALNGLKKFDQAIVEASEAIQYDPTMAGAYRERAVARLAKSQFDLAIADLNQIIAWDGQRAPPRIFTEAYAFRAAAHFCKGAFDSAIADATVAIQRDPKYISALEVRAAASSATGDNARAAEDLGTAASMQSATKESGSLKLCPVS
jgi:tetratricopeptide (TPR) repeat protein